MPERINGIGTTYLGRKNVDQQQGVCESCQRSSMLQNYETQLWFTFVYLPIIPLGKKQVLDYCSHCTRHRVVEIGEWVRAKSESIDQNATELAQNQDDPEAAINMHATLASFGEGPQAAELAGVMRSRFADHVDVQLYLGSWYERSGHATEADACFARALQVEPDNLFAKRAVAVAMIEQGHPAEARQLLAGLEPPSEHYDPAIFILLGHAFQKQQNHEEALRAYQMVLSASPAVGAEKDFRAAVRRSEVELGRQQSIVRADPFYKSKPFLVGSLAVIVFLGIFGINYAISQRRDLHVVNGLSTPISVSIDDGDAFTVEAYGRHVVTVAEGNHHATVADPEALSESVKFTLSCGWFQRFFSDPAYILDPGRTAIITWEQQVYGDRPGEEPYQFGLVAGQTLTTYDDIDFHFEEFPNEIETESRSATKTRVGMVTYSPAEVFAYHTDKFDASTKLDVLEQHLLVAPNDVTLLTSYVGQAMSGDAMQRCLKLLNVGVVRRPVETELHRLYQTLRERQGQTDDLVEQYDAFIAADPDNSVLLYLRSRLSATTQDSLAWLDKAISKDPSNGYAWSAKSYRLTAAGQFGAARAACDEALKLQPDRRSVNNLDRQILLAQRQWPELESKIKKLIDDDPLNASAYSDSMGVFVARGMVAAADEQYQKFADIIQKRGNGDPFQSALYLQLILRYLKQDYQGMLSAAASIKDEAERAGQEFTANIEMGRVSEAAAALEKSGSAKEGIYRLCLALVCQQQGDPQQAEEWIAKAVVKLENESSENRYIAKLINSSQEDPITAEQAEAITAQPQIKSIALLVLAENSTSTRTELLDMAESMNFEQGFPHHFVDGHIRHLRAIDDRSE